MENPRFSWEKSLEITMASSWQTVNVDKAGSIDAMRSYLETEASDFSPQDRDVVRRQGKNQKRRLPWGFLSEVAGASPVVFQNEEPRMVGASGET